MFEKPDQGQGCGEFAYEPLLDLSRHQAGFKQAFRENQGRDKPKHEQGLSGMIVPVMGRHRVARGLNNAPADGGNGDCNQDPGGGVILYDVVNAPKVAAETGQFKPVHKSHEHQLGGASARG